MIYDAIVAGAGPAGALAAFFLARAGFSVVMLDKASSPGKKACAGGLTPKALNLFPYDLSSVIEKRCQTIQVTPEQGKPFTISDPQGLCFMTVRARLDRLCVQKAVEMGAAYITDAQVNSVVEKEDRVEVGCASGRCFTGTYLIGADGANSVIRRFLYKKEGVLKQLAVEADLFDAKNMSPEMEFNFKYNKNGYFWVFPKKDRINIGMFTTNTDDRSGLSALKRFADEKFGVRTLSNVTGYPICTHGSVHRLGSRRILLCGDAAGCAEPLLGEGLYFALKSGILAAEALMRSQVAGLGAGFCYQQAMMPVFADLKLHEKACRWFYSHRDLGLKILSRRLIHQPFAYGYARGLTLSSIFSFKLISRFHRERISI